MTRLGHRRPATECSAGTVSKRIWRYTVGRGGEQRSKKGRPGLYTPAGRNLAVTGGGAGRYESSRANSFTFLRLNRRGINGLGDAARP